VKNARISLKMKGKNLNTIVQLMVHVLNILLNALLAGLNAMSIVIIRKRNQLQTNMLLVAVDVVHAVDNKI